MVYGDIGLLEDAPFHENEQEVFCPLILDDARDVSVATARPSVAQNDDFGVSWPENVTKLILQVYWRLLPRACKNATLNVFCAENNGSLKGRCFNTAYEFGGVELMKGNFGLGVRATDNGCSNWRVHGEAHNARFWKR
ncbi:hypothetical protein JG688_00002531 [Phytophthora aleatoria]|uniref:Uncharacterized protein n=1 Tax=Phytophthora aleatoria TaxID=2496075 RepID=A0A8J5MCQ2_9STRA|nr:hypothetical protein JG688_00002531 [Phytophthora aleatoria]